MEKVRPWCGQPSDRGRLKIRSDSLSPLQNSGPRNSFHCLGHSKNVTASIGLSLAVLWQLVTCTTAMLAWWSQRTAMAASSTTSARHPSDNHDPSPSKHNATVHCRFRPRQPLHDRRNQHQAAGALTRNVTYKPPCHPWCPL